MKHHTIKNLRGIDCNKPGGHSNTLESPACVKITHATAYKDVTLKVTKGKSYSQITCGVALKSFCLCVRCGTVPESISQTLDQQGSPPRGFVLSVGIR